MRLTDLQIRKLKPPEQGQKTYFDDTLRGFGVRVSQGGTKSFVVMYGKRRQLRTLGRYPDLALSDARKEAKQVQGEVLGLPPAATALAKLTFAEAREQFLRDSAPRIKASTHGEYARLLHKHFTFEKQLCEVSRADVMQTLSALNNTPSTEHHAFVAVRTMMNWCVRQGLLSVSPVPPLRFSTKSRSRILTDDELKLVWQRAEEVGYPYGRIVQLLILTGQRRGEIAGLRRSWIEGNTITFPEGFTKNKREHRIPIGELTQQLIANLPGDVDLLFPSRHGDDRPFSGWSKAKRQFDEPLTIAPFVLHDFRRTYSSNLAKLGVPIHVTEKLLNHMSGSMSGVAGVYNRHSYWEEMCEAVFQFHKSLQAVAQDRFAEAESA